MKYTHSIKVPLSSVTSMCTIHGGCLPISFRQLCRVEVRKAGQLILMKTWWQHGDQGRHLTSQMLLSSEALVSRQTDYPIRTDWASTFTTKIFSTRNPKLCKTNTNTKTKITLLRVIPSMTCRVVVVR